MQQFTNQNVKITSMKTGDFVYANTHAEFLNKVFGTNYKAWMRSSWKYNNMYVWMVRFNETDGGWRNTFVSNNCIKEENIGKHETWDGNPVEMVLKTRITFEITGQSNYRKYTFKGIFTYNEKNSDPKNRRYFDKISDEIIIR